MPGGRPRDWVRTATSRGSPVDGSIIEPPTRTRGPRLDVATIRGDAGIGMIRLDAATVLLQWATGGLLFLWVTTRRREVGLGYGWLLRGVFGLFAAGAAAVGSQTGHPSTVRDVASTLVAVAAFGALGVSIARRKAGVAGQLALAEQRSARVAAMTGIDRAAAPADRSGPEFPPRLDLVAPVIGAIGLIAAAHADGGPLPLAI